MINLERVEVCFGRSAPALSLERLRIERGERVAIIGPSGAGKSTLLRSIKGYVRPSRGKIEVMGVDHWTARWDRRRQIRRHLGLIYQQFHLLSRLSVLENVLCGRLGGAGRWASLVGWFSTEDHRIAWSAICEVGLQKQVHQRVDTLSGGERQRVAVARVVAQQPSIILADEPVSSLDPAWAEDVLQLIATVQTHHEATLVMSLHQPHLARRFAERIIGLRSGKLHFDGRPSALTDKILEDLYRGDEMLRFGDGPTSAATAPATPA